MRTELVNLSEMAEENDRLWVLGGTTAEKVTLKSLISKLLVKLDRYLCHLSHYALGIIICGHKHP